MIVAVGTFQLASYLAITASFVGLDGLVTPVSLVSFGINLALAAPVVWAGVWLGRSDVSPPRYAGVPGWWAGGVVFFVLLNLPLVALVPDMTTQGVVGWIHYSAVTGSAAGVIVGVSQARAVERARVAQQAETAAARAEEQRKWFDYLNGLLRHEVLNNAHVISGYADQALADDSGAVDASLRTIRSQSEDMTRVIQDVRVLIESQHGGGSLEPVDLSAVLADELADAEAADPSVRVEAFVPDGVHVRADDLVNRVFGNLFANAVEHNDGEEPTLEVSVETTADDVIVHVSDDGPGIPPDVREHLFERTGRGDHGVGLYLVHELVERYDGCVELTASGRDGTTFSVTLPRAEPPREAADGSASRYPEPASLGYARN